MSGSVDYHDLLRELNSSTFETLRPLQAQTLSAYAAEFADQRDVAIELPTGVGKSLIALLIGEAWRREGKTVAILTGNKTLARQMEQEANLLGINIVRMEGSGSSSPRPQLRRYHRTQSIAVMNYWVYFNENPVVDPADLLIMDDAHLAEHCLHSLYSVEITRSSHETLFHTMVTELAKWFPDYSVLQDALDPTAPASPPAQLMSFLDQHRVRQRLQEIVDVSVEQEMDADLRFRWRRLRDNLEEANLYLSNRALWLRPYVYPLLRNEHYERVQQRIYMSATIGDTADLSRRLGTLPIRKISVQPEQPLAANGRRLLIMNTSDSEFVSDRLSTLLQAALQVHPKSLWLCSSRFEADQTKRSVVEWLNSNGFIGHPTWTLTSLGNEIDDFKRAPAGHLFVAGRFDGMDFKADECRLVVLTTLPRATNPQEEFLSAYLRDARFMLERLNQRIVQALGRCNRASDDFAVYILADQRFSGHFSRASYRVGLPSDIVAELDYAEDNAEANTQELARRVGAFLSGDFTRFDQDIGDYFDDMPTTSKSDGDKPEVDVANHEVMGWAELYDSRNYRKAREYFAQCAQITNAVDKRELSAFFLWCEAKAAFLEGERGDVIARAEALDLLENAIHRGGRSAWFNRLRTSLNRQLASTGSLVGPVPIEYPETVIGIFDDHLELFGTKGTRFQRWIDQINQQIRSSNHDEFTNALQEVGQILGFRTVRPKYSASTDCRWRGVFGNSRELVTFEAKVEQASSNTITPKMVGQAHNQLNRAKAEYGNRGYNVRGTIITHLTEIDPSAESSLGELRIIQRDVIVALWNHVNSIFSRYRDNWSSEDGEARLTAADITIPKLPRAGWLARALSSEEIWITEDQLLSEWP